MPITPVLSSIATNPLANGLNKSDTPERIRKAATDFEALLLAQILTSAREANGGGLAGEDDQGNSTMLELGEQQFAQALANSGGLGIAKMVVTGLNKNANR